MDNNTDVRISCNIEKKGKFFSSFRYPAFRVTAPKLCASMRIVKEFIVSHFQITSQIAPF